MADHQFADNGLAELCDLFHPWQEQDDLGFYLPLVMAAENVLDIGCGTGMLLHRARSSGHGGRLCGLDPAHGMLEQARTRPDISRRPGSRSNDSTGTGPETRSPPPARRSSPSPGAPERRLP
ncbi:methyltransferase family protein [Micromonospora pisi]|uniref:Methyltransferase family protein n=1 Tax=Micromonospora pisi TaxID=589240 RepID=A0A495JKP5_9ACTN|nr:class I SAM-dependent methyltransferase [Micromonospora pisi]RKR89630.1 methyltransferase family protein [Micromonospora pisi]